MTNLFVKLDRGDIVNLHQVRLIIPTYKEGQLISGIVYFQYDDEDFVHITSEDYERIIKLLFPSGRYEY